jgi:glutamine synthetase adenylyltransferase
MSSERPIGSEAAWSRVPVHAIGEVSTCLSHLKEAIGARPELDVDRLIQVLGASATARAVMHRRPELLDRISPLDPVRDAAQWRSDLDQALTGLREPEAVGAVLRARRENVEIVTLARQLQDADVVSAGRELSDFADAAVLAALDFCSVRIQGQYGQPLGRDGNPCPHILLALDKWGGREMNLRPRLSLMLVHGGRDGRTDGAGGLGERVASGEYFNRLLSEVVTLLEGQRIYDVDLSRVPERGAGDLAKRVDELEAYYAQQGHAWHRLAWVRARLVRGDTELHAELMEVLRPFVYPRATTPALLDNLAAVKTRIADRASRLAQRDGFDVKLGRGGIRQLEFTVQGMQLLWGGRHPQLRAASTLTTLGYLVDQGPLEPEEAQALTEAWCFLRQLEHAAQAAGYQRQADRGRARWLAGDRLSREAIARTCGFEGVEAFEEALAHHRQEVAAAFDALLAGESVGDPDQFGACFEALVDAEDVDEAILAEALAPLGLRAPTLAMGRLVGMSRAPEAPFHPRWLARETETARRILREVAEVPDPDAALAHLESMVRRFGHDRAIFEVLAQDPARMQALLTVFGTSATLSRFLLGDWRSLRRLVHEGPGEPVRSRAEMMRDAQRDGPEEAVADGGFMALRLFVRVELIRIGLHDLTGVLDTASVAGQLADLVDVVVRRVLALTGAAADEVDEPTVEVLAFGRWAARELGYGDRVSALVVHGDDVVSSRRARQVVSVLEDVLAQGHLLRLNPVLWSDGASRGYLAAVDGLHTDGPLPLGLAVARSVAKQGTPQRSAAGCHAPEVPTYGDEGVFFIEEAVRVLADGAVDGSAMGILARLADEGRVTPEEASRAAEVHAFLRRLENRAAIVHDNPGWLMGHLLEPDPDTQLRAVRRHLARCAGYADGTEGGPDAALVDDVRRCRADAKNLHVRACGHAAGSA